jgi:hypothetical protein
MISSRFDEGYSEDTRSQSGSDLVMRTDSRLGEAMGMDQDAQYPLPDWVMNMNETERSGMARPSLISCGMLMRRRRIRLRAPPLSADLLDSRHSGEAEPPTSPRPCRTPPTRDNVPDLLVPRPRNAVARINAVQNMASSSDGQSSVETPVSS